MNNYPFFIKIVADDVGEIISILNGETK